MRNNAPTPEEVMHTLQDTNPYSVKLVNLIRVVERIGDGTEASLVQFKFSYYTPDGQLLATSFDNALPAGCESSEDRESM